MKIYTSLALFCLLLALDQLTKFGVREYLEEVVNLFWIFDLERAFNTGVAFSMQVPQALVLGITFGVCVWLGWELLGKSKENQLRDMWMYALILAGAVGNLIDRVLFGAVTDFISIGNFPIFNLADSFITVGIVLFIFREIFE